MTMAPAPHYGAELARIHHEHFGMVARAAATELLRRLERAGIVSGTVADLAAGTGIVAAAVLAAGFDAWCVDISPEMLGIAAKTAPRATLVRESLWKVELPPCVAVAAVGEAFSYAIDPAASLAALEERLSSVQRALCAGGLLLFDVAGPGRSGDTGMRRAFWQCDGTYLGFEEHEDPEARRIRRTITLFVPEGERYRREQETHELLLFDREQIEALLTRLGYRFERLVRLDAYELAPGWHAYAATKR